MFKRYRRPDLKLRIAKLAAAVRSIRWIERRTAALVSSYPATSASSKTLDIDCRCHCSNRQTFCTVAPEFTATYRPTCEKVGFLSYS